MLCWAPASAGVDWLMAVLASNTGGLLNYFLAVLCSVLTVCASDAARNEPKRKTCKRAVTLKYYSIPSPLSHAIQATRARKRVEVVKAKGEHDDGAGSKIRNGARLEGGIQGEE